MSKSPYIPQEVKLYMEQNKIEDVLKEAVNEILSSRPADPFTAFSQFFGKLSTPSVIIESIDALEIMNNEMKPTIQLSLVVQFKNSSMVYQPQIYFSQATTEQEIYYDDEQKNMKNAIQAILKLSPSLAQKNMKEQKNIDDILVKYLNENHSHINVIQQISFSLIPTMAHFMNQKLNKLLCQTLNKIEATIPKLFINILQGSKVVQSKCKVYKFLLISNENDSIQKIQAVTQNVRKSIVSGKKGEAGLQFYSDGTFICPADTILDNLKILEQAIDQAQAKESISVGLVWLSELFYMVEEKKYDLDNPKKLLDADQMIDYYFKLCSDKPIISYIEDPLYHGDFFGWNKLMNKFKDTKVKIGSRRLYQNIEKAKKHCEQISAQTNPDLSEQQIQQMNNERINLDYVFKTLYEFSTFTETQNYIQYINTKKPDTHIILGDTLTDTEDTYVIDVSFSTNNGCLNMGAPSKFEKLIKYNKFLKLCHDLK